VVLFGALALSLATAGCARQTRFDVQNASDEDLSVLLLRNDSGEVLAGDRLSPGGSLDVTMRLGKRTHGMIKRYRGDKPVGPGVKVPVFPGGWTSLTVDVEDDRIVVHDWRRLRSKPF